MLELTGRDYGLPRAPGHPPPSTEDTLPRVDVMAASDLVLTKAIPPAWLPAKRRAETPINRTPAAQPWESRPARKRAA